MIQVRGNEILTYEGMVCIW